MSRSIPARKLRQVAVAAAVALAVQFLAFRAIVGDFTGSAPTWEQPAIEAEMFRPPPPPQAERPPTHETEKRQPPPPSAADARIAEAPSGWTAPPAGTGLAVAEPEPAPSPVESRDLRLGCLGKPIVRLKGEARYACEKEIRAVLAERKGGPLDRPIDPEKRAAYDAAAARQANRRAAVSRLGNGASIGCPQSNLGAGCPDDMLIPLGKKKF